MSGGTTETRSNTIAPYMEEAAKTQLGKVMALTDTNQNPYQQYGGNRIAEFNPMQQQFFQGVQNLGTSGAVGQGIDTAGQAVGRALNTSYNPYQTGQFGAQASQYMDPYMQNVVDIQQREAQRQADIAGTQRGAQAVKYGAFGGSRQAILDAEANRNLAMQKGDIQARGLQDAFTRGQQQFNTEQALGEASRQYGAGLGLKGLDTALAGAAQLGGLGATQFGQQKDILGLQQGVGAQQQMQEQTKLSQDYEDFLNKQKYPYQQLEFASNIMRGTPYSSTTSMYSPGPTALQSLGSLGTAAYGLSKLGMFGAKEGGTVSSYAVGGSVDSAQNIEAIVERLSDSQLKQAADLAQARGDAEQLQIIQQEMASRASERGGMMGAFNQLPQEQQQQMMAGGGIVAFAQPTAENNWSLVSEPEDEDEDAPQPVAPRIPVGRGDPKVYAESMSGLQALQKKLADDKGYSPLTEAQEKALYDRSTARGKEIYGDVLSKIKANIDAQRNESKGSLDQAKGLAALEAAAALSEGRGLVQGLGKAGRAFGRTYGDALRADREQKRALASMDLNLAKAEADQRMGLHDKAEAQIAKANANRERAYNAGVSKNKALAGMLYNSGRLALPPAPVKSGSGAPKPLKLAEQLAAAEVAHETNPTDATLANVTALRRAVAQTKTSDYGPTRASDVGGQQDIVLGDQISKAQQKLKFTPEYVKATPAEKAQMLRDEATRVRQNAGRSAGVNNNSPRVPQNDYSNLWGGTGN
jgi:hypothetical protein